MKSLEGKMTIIKLQDGEHEVADLSKLEELITKYPKEKETIFSHIKSNYQFFKYAKLYPFDFAHLLKLFPEHKAYLLTQLTENLDFFRCFVHRGTNPLDF